MSDSEGTDNDFVDELDKATEPPPPEPEPKKGKKGMRKSTPATEERLAILARAREKALAVRKANAEKNGKGKIREEAKQKAVANKKEADNKFNDRVEQEVKKRMDQLHLDKINEVVDEKIKQTRPPKKAKKKVV